MKILVVGASGSGTSTLGRAVANSEGWRFIDADDYYWLPTTPPYEQKRDHGERLQLILAEQAKSENSVIAGSVMNWGERLENSFDYIVFLTLDTSIRVERLRIREKREVGKVDEAFIQWAADYDDGLSEGRSLVRHENWLSERLCPILRLEGDMTVKERQDRLMSIIKRD